MPNIKALDLVVLGKKSFSLFPFISYVKHVTPRRGHFWPQGHNLNKLGRGLLVDATYQISSLYAVLFQTRRFFHIFPN